MMEVTIYVTANRRFLACKSVITSIPNVEKVVYAPQNPIPKKYQIQSLISFSTYIFASSPRSKDPDRVVIHVLNEKGDLVDNRFVNHSPNRYRTTDPIEPPVPTRQIVGSPPL